jgi:hypothetical protein
MIRNRQFLFGLGAGLIAGALLLQLMNVAQSQSHILSSEEDVREAAKTLGLKVYEGSEQVYSQDEWKAKEKEESASNATSSPNAPIQPSTPAAPEGAVKPTSAPVESPAPAVQPSAAAAAPSAATPQPSTPAERVKIKISAGSTLTEVATKLKASGIISDKAAFIQQAKKWNASRTIQTGTYTFAKGESFKSITDKITTKIK